MWFKNNPASDYKKIKLEGSLFHFTYGRDTGKKAPMSALKKVVIADV